MKRIMKRIIEYYKYLKRNKTITLTYVDGLNDFEFRVPWYVRLVQFINDVLSILYNNIMGNTIWKIIPYSEKWHYRFWPTIGRLDCWWVTKIEKKYLGYE